MKMTPCIVKPRSHRRAFAASRAVAFITARKFMKLSASSFGGTQSVPFTGQGRSQ
jgi:hypothetical protein